MFYFVMCVKCTAESCNESLPTFPLNLVKNNE